MDAFRQDWVEFICSEKHAGRYLYSGGHATFGEPSQIEEFQVGNFLERLASAKADVHLISLLYFLAQPRVVTFFNIILPDLMRSISHVKIGQEQLSRRGVRGKISWTATSKARASGKIDVSTFVVRRNDKSSDIPENQLLKLFLTRVSMLLDEATTSVGSGVLLREFDSIRAQTNQVLKSPYLANVTTIQTPNSLMYQRARRHRNYCYGKLAQLCEEFDAIFQQNHWESVINLLRQGWLMPVEDDDILELYVLVMIMDVFINELGFDEPYQYGLIRSGRKEVARFLRSSDSVRADIYFDQTPKSVFGLRSRYTKILADYNGITGAEHRPDIIIRFIFPDDSERRLIIEVKDTQDDRYKRDSVYKVFAYLYDFKEIWDEQPTQSPKAILTITGHLEKKSGVNEDGCDLMFVSASNRNMWARCLNATLAACL